MNWIWKGKTMNFALALQQPTWRTIITIPRGTVIPKGRTNNNYKAITVAAGNIQERFGCYAWSDNANIFYIGSFADDYSGGRFDSNFQGRVHNYLQNHKISDTGFKNTNLRVFENINAALQITPISLCLLTFVGLQIDNATLSFSSFTADSDLVKSVEQLLKTIYRRHGQCQWNRM
jgi:hypothetical protein